MKIHKLKTSECYFAVFSNASKETQTLIINPIVHWNDNKQLDLTFGAQNILEVSTLPAFLHAEALQSHWDMPLGCSEEQLIEQMVELGFVHNAELASHAEKGEDLSLLDIDELEFVPVEEEHIHHRGCGCEPEANIPKEEPEYEPEEDGKVYSPSECYYGIFHDVKGKLYDVGDRVIYLSPKKYYDFFKVLHPEMQAGNFNDNEVPSFISDGELMESTWDFPENMTIEEVRSELEKSGFTNCPGLEK